MQNKMLEFVNNMLNIKYLKKKWQYFILLSNWLKYFAYCDRYDFLEWSLQN